MLPLGGIISLLLAEYYIGIFNRLSGVIQSGFQTPMIVNDRYIYLVRAARLHRIGVYLLAAFCGYVAVRFIVWAARRLKMQ